MLDNGGDALIHAGGGGEVEILLLNHETLPGVV
jgi:hypothetical protein